MRGCCQLVPPVSERSVTLRTMRLGRKRAGLKRQILTRRAGAECPLFNIAPMTNRTG